MKVAVGVVVAAMMFGSSSSLADVVVLGNTETGAVVIRGNLPDGTEAEEAVQEARGQRPDGWTQLFADDEKGWGAVVCVRHKDGVYFSQVNGQQSEADAIRVAKIGADRFIKEHGKGMFIPLCAPRWNNDGQKIAFGGDGVPEWQEGHSDSGVVDYAKGTIRNAVGAQKTDRDYKRDCVRPEPAPSSRGKLGPIGTGVAPLSETQKKPASPADDWKPAAWCPKPSTVTGVRG